MSDIYHHKPEVWSKTLCEKLAKSVARDGMGTKYPFKGYLGSSACRPSTFGLEKYNGGCIRNGKWYAGEFRPFPILPNGFKIVVVPTWGWQIKKV